MSSDVLIREWHDFLPKLISALVLFLVSLGVASFAGHLVSEAVKRREGPPEIKILLRRLTKWALIVMGTIAALQQVEINVTSFIAGLGVVGFALAFAFQGIAKNFIAGALLLLQRPFQLGDVIQVQDFTGRVTNISLRDTTIETFDGQEVVIPNADVYASPIVNRSTHPLRRKSFTIGLGYEEDIGRARKVFQKALSAVPGVKDEPAPRVVCTNLADSWVELTAYYWFTPGEVDYFEMSSGAIQVIKEAAEREGIDLPYPI